MDSIENESKTKDETASTLSPSNETTATYCNISNLPIELSLLILSYLDVRDLLEASRVSKRWRALVNMDLVWKRICTMNAIQNENFPYELGAGDPPDEDSWCRWARIYKLSLYRRQKWKQDEYQDLCPQSNPPTKSFGVHGTTIAIGHWRRGLTVYTNTGDEIIPLQMFDTISEVRDVVVAVNSLVLLVEDWIVVHHLWQKHFIVETIFHAMTEQRLGSWSELHQHLQQDNTETDFACSKILLVTDVSIWLKSNCLKIFIKDSQTFMNYNVNPVTDLKSNQNWVATLRPESIDLYQHNGTLVYSIQSCSFYTGLVMSFVGLAFLESLDFEEPNAAYVDLRTRKKTVLFPKLYLKVYRLTLFQSTIYCLSGCEKFQLSCHSSKGEPKFIVPLVGSKYLRPGKDFFEIICCKFIFISPATVRLDVFELFDKDTGSKLFTVPIFTSSYNISLLSDTGLVLRLDSYKQKSGCCGGNVISWRSMV